MLVGRELDGVAEEAGGNSGSVLVTSLRMATGGVELVGVPADEVGKVGEAEAVRGDPVITRTATAITNIKRRTRRIPPNDRSSS